MQLSQTHLKIFEALKENPELEECILEIMDVAGDKTGIKTGDDAEDATIEVIHKTGAAMLRGWVEKREQKANELSRQDPNLRPHKKGLSNGTLL